MNIRNSSMNTPQNPGSQFYFNPYATRQSPLKTEDQTFKIAKTFNRNTRGNVQTLTDNDFQSKSQKKNTFKEEKLSNYFQVKGSHKMNTQSSHLMPNTLESSCKIEYKDIKLQALIQKQQSHHKTNENIMSKEVETPNFTLYLIYKKKQLQIKLNITNKTSLWLKNCLKNEILEYEQNTLNSPNFEQEIQSIIGFQSANKNIQITYILSLNHKTLTLFENATLSLEPIYIEKPSFITPDDTLGLKDFTFIKCIGLGGFSRVYLVSKKDSDQLYAMKLLDKQFILKNCKEGIVQNERNIMVKMSHPFLLKLEFCFETRNYLCFVTEYCSGGEMFYHLRKIKKMNEDQARFYFTEICLGIEQLHNQFIIYRDIKPENIFLDGDGHARIGDFGLAKPDMDVNEFAYSFCGSPEYMPPEMLLKVGHSYPVDYYCLGAILYELVTGLPPFYSHDTDQIYESILSEELTFPQHASNLSQEIKNLMRTLLVKHPMNRAGHNGGIREILNHVWFRKINIKDVIDKKIEPPIKPDILQFNFDEKEFVKGEAEFKKKLVQCQQDPEEEKCQKYFKNFYYENVKKTITNSPQKPKMLKPRSGKKPPGQQNTSKHSNGEVPAEQPPLTQQNLQHNPRNTLQQSTSQNHFSRKNQSSSNTPRTELQIHFQGGMIGGPLQTTTNNKFPNTKNPINQVLIQKNLSIQQQNLMKAQIKSQSNIKIKSNNFIQTSFKGRNSENELEVKGVKGRPSDMEQQIAQIHKTEEDDKNQFQTLYPSKQSSRLVTDQNVKKNMLKQIQRNPSSVLQSMDQTNKNTIQNFQANLKLDSKKI